MAMLAEPRRKQKYSVNPNGLDWTNDNKNFGHKLLEKMGWQKGKGLGAQEDGNVEPVKISKKFDTRGVGCSKKHADNWIAHQDDFNSLLSSLGNDSGQNTPTEDAVQCLETKSKLSKKGLHYHKFTKGKNLSNAKKHDLDQILGKRKKVKEVTSSSSEDSSSAEAEKPHEDETKYVQSTMSVQEYFAQKMAALKKKRECGDDNEKVEVEQIENNENDDDDKDCEIQEGNKKRKKSKKDKKRDKDLHENEINNENILESDKAEIVDSKNSKKKKSKKSKKDKKDNMEDQPEASEIEAIVNVTEEADVMESEAENYRKKKKKSKKSKQKDEVDITKNDEKIINNEDSKIDSKTSCKMKGSKRRKDNVDASVTENRAEHNDNSTDSKNRKRKKDDSSLDESEEKSESKRAKISKGGGIRTGVVENSCFPGSNFENIIGYGVKAFNINVPLTKKERRKRRKEELKKKAEEKNKKTEKQKKTKTKKAVKQKKITKTKKQKSK